MLNVFRSFELQYVLIRNIDTYGALVLLNKKLSHEFVRISLAKCFVTIRKLSESQTTKTINTYIFNVPYDGYIKTYWLGYLLHRDNDLPAVVYSHRNDQEWYQYGKRHRGNDQPAVIQYYGYIKKWYQHGKKHRDYDLPAAIYHSPNGRTCYEFWKNGKQYYF